MVADVPEDEGEGGYRTLTLNCIHTIRVGFMIVYVIVLYGHK